MKTFRKLFPVLVLTAAAMFGLAVGFGPHLIKGPLPSVVTASATPPANVPDLRWWWVAEDLANGSVVSWTDRVIGSVFTNGAAATRPTKSADGVRFQQASSQRLTNVDDIMPSDDPNNSCFFFIVKLTSAGFMDILTSAPNEGSTTIGFESTPKPYYYSVMLITDGTIAQNTYLDFALVGHSDAGHLNPSITFYTNGVVSNTNTSKPLTGNFRCLGGDSPGGFFDGYVQELILYSNTLTAANISSLHQYATNKYGYTP